MYIVFIELNRNLKTILENEKRKAEINMNENELMQFAIKGIEAEIQRREKAIRTGERLLRPYRKGLAKPNEKKVSIEKRIGELKVEIKVLEDKLFNLRWELENGPVNV